MGEELIRRAKEKMKIRKKKSNCQKGKIIRRELLMSKTKEKLNIRKEKLKIAKEKLRIAKEKFIY